MRKKVNMLVCSLMLSSALALPQTNAYAAGDDITGISLEKEMRAMIEKGILQGKGEGVYEPNLDVTRGQFATFITRSLDLPDGPPVFEDVPVSSGLAKGINAASAVKIVNGYSKSEFRPNEPITREQAAAMVDNAFNYLQIARGDALLNFSDSDQINNKFKLAVARNSQDNIIRGIGNGDGTFRFEPKTTASRAHAAAFIQRMLLKIGDQQPPETGEGTGSLGYQVASIGAEGKLNYFNTIFASFENAQQAITNSNSQVITYNSQIIKMGAGLVYSKPNVGQPLTMIYSDPGLTKAVTYVTGQQEMKYLDATSTYVKVNVAGMTAYVKQSEVSLIPLAMVKGRNFYTTNNARDLVHYIYNPLTNTSVSYSLGIAPSFMVTGGKYYSWDGAEFTDTNGRVLGTAPQYFNYLPARTKTNYTAEELNRYIDTILAEKEALYAHNPTTFARYKDATTKSKIKNLGADLKAAEAKHKINALLILSMAMHESDMGMSRYAQDRNNLFGIKAYDSNEDAAEVFTSPLACIDALATRYLNKNYINPVGSYFNGGVTGNKAIGFNMKYASDPYWGQKISGHMYRTDKFLGQKDFGKYTIGFTNATGLNIRTTPESNATNLVFTYKNAGNPVAIIDSVTQPDGSKWYKILSDSLNSEEVYVFSTFVDEKVFAK
jgi:beta-N-acetylglucosaminidase